jgi:hypothetical protein
MRVYGTTISNNSNSGNSVNGGTSCISNNNGLLSQA